MMWTRRKTGDSSRQTKDEAAADDTTSAQRRRLMVDRTRAVGRHLHAAVDDYGVRIQEALQKQSFRSGHLLTTTTTEPLKTMGDWEVQIPPAKRRRAAGRLVPTVRGGVALGGPGLLIPRRRRRVAVEIHGPPPDMRLEEPPPPDDDDENNNNEGAEESSETLEDHEVVVLRVYMATTTTPNVDADDDDGDDGEEELLSMKSYRIEDIVILDRRGRVCETQVGSGDETKVYDLWFQSEEENLNFAELVEHLRASELSRSKRQAELYEKEQRNKKGSGHDDSSEETTSIDLLLEIVSATNLPTAGAFSSRNPYIIVKMGGSEIHRTKVLSKTVDPVWSLETGSLFLVQMDPHDFFTATGGIMFLLGDHRSLGTNKVLGRVRVGLQQLLQMKGERVGFDIALENDIQVLSSVSAQLYLRIKEASKSDVEFMKTYEKYAGLVGVYASETYELPRPPDIEFLKRYKKKVVVDPESKEKIVLTRVRPYPDPERPDETEWLLPEQIEQESQKPSKNWVDAGSGDLGRLFVEILGCDGLPNLALTRTSNILDKTHIFVCIVYEDTVVNTDVIGDSRSPRWMPWSKRAFTFPVAHPQSDLYIGVFFYNMEQSPLQMTLRTTHIKRQHNRIGRTSVTLTQFNPETVYSLTYPIYYGELQQNATRPRGTISFRLRLEWKDTRKTMLAALKPPSPSFVSCPRKIDWKVARYTVEGVHDDTKYSINSFARYIAELQGYRAALLPFLEEVLMTAWLWRGHYRIDICGWTLWLPLHSILAFAWALIIYRDLNYIPSFLMFSIGWIFLTTNEIMRRTPSRWEKPRGYGQLWSILLFGNFFIQDIVPNDNLDELREYEESQQRKQHRRIRAIELRTQYEEALRKELGPDIHEVEVEDIATKAAESLADSLNVRPLKPILHPVQLKLRRIVLVARFASKFFLWKETYYAFWITTFSFVAGALVSWVPWGVVLRWTTRVSIVFMSGPWMKLVDWLFFCRPAEMSEEEYDAYVKEKLQKRFDRVIRAISGYQVKKERAVKLKSMKKYLYGKFLIRIPRVSLDLFRDTPLPQSFARVFQKNTSEPINVTERKFGQHLSGDMIPLRDIQTSDMQVSNLKEVKVGPLHWVKGVPRHVGKRIPLLAKQSPDKDRIGDKKID